MVLPASSLNTTNKYRNGAIPTNVVLLSRPSEGEAAALGVTHFVQVWVAGELDHGRGAAHQDEGVVSGRGEVLPDHLFTDEALTVRPV